MSLTIGELARTTGARIQTIRYYESVGLLPHPARTEGKQRRFEQAHVDRVNFIRHGRELGFSLGAVKDLLALADSPHAPCEGADRIAQRQLDDVRGRIERLESLRDELARMLERCQGGQVATCRVLQALADHGACMGHTPMDEEGLARRP